MINRALTNSMNFKHSENVADMWVDVYYVVERMGKDGGGGFVGDGWDAGEGERSFVKPATLNGLMNLHKEEVG